MIACEFCDLLHRPRPLQPGEVVGLGVVEQLGAGELVLTVRARGLELDLRRGLRLLEVDLQAGLLELGERGVAVVVIDRSKSDVFRGGLIARGFRPAVQPLS